MAKNFTRGSSLQSNVSFELIGKLLKLPTVAFKVNEDSLMSKQSATKAKIRRSSMWGNHSFFSKTVILRGVGYKFFIISNDLGDAKGVNPIAKDSAEEFETHNMEDAVNFFSKNTLYDFTCNKYLVVRAGHTKDLYQPMPEDLSLKVNKKDRKLVIYGKDKAKVAQFAIDLFRYRMPRVYTGRGIRRKHVKVIRKAGKKDKQKGRI